MRMVLILTLTVVAVLYSYLAGFNQPIDKTTVIAGHSGAGTIFDVMPVETLTTTPSNPPPLLKSASSVPAGQTSSSSDNNVAPSGITGRHVGTTVNSNERIAALWRLADHNKAQLYDSLWQALEVEDLDDTDFRELILATLEQFGNTAPGEILAALLRSAPTPELRSSALRLITEASQELSIDLLIQALEDPEPIIRQSAQAFFDEIGVDVLLEVLADVVLGDDQAVRLLAFSTLEEMYKFAPVWEVAELVLNDPDPKIRMRALELLTYGNHALAIDRLALALGDPNPEISELALALLMELENESS